MESHKINVPNHPNQMGIQIAGKFDGGFSSTSWWIAKGYSHQHLIFFLGETLKPRF
jgi:hypothetical protein